MTQSSINLSVVHLTIDDDHYNQRIDNYLINRLKGLPKSRIYRLLRKGEVRVNKKRAKPEYKLQIGDIVRIPPIRLENQENTLPNARLGQIQALDERILFEDDALIILDKPSGMAVHGGSGLSFGVIEALRAKRVDSRYLELVHRLDRDTSGCLMIAKKRSMLRHLHHLLQTKALKKDYWALVHGHWARGDRQVGAPLYKQQLKSGERLVRVDPQGKEALTRFKVLTQYEAYSLMEASPVTGRTHQIRVHCLHKGHPIAGDAKYSSDVQRINASAAGINRLFLHATRLSFTDLSGMERQVEAPLDASLEACLRTMK